MEEDSKRYLSVKWLFDDGYNLSGEFSEHDGLDKRTSRDSYSDFLSPLESSIGGLTLENISLSGSGCSFDEGRTDEEYGSEEEHSLRSGLGRDGEDDKAGENSSGDSITDGKRLHGHINDVINNVIRKQKTFESQNYVYSIIRLLGYGYYGTVFLSKMRVKGQEGSQSHQLVAIKVINFEHMRTDSYSNSGNNTIVDIIDQLNDEINILVTMKSHANVINYIESFYINPHYLAFVTDYISGYTLRDVYKSYGPFSESLICFVCEPILRVLHILNSHNYRYKRIHKDIKSNNIMIDYNTCQIKLLDFGVSQILDSIMYHTPKISSGTLQWMSPELIQSRDYDHLTDIWSLGITLLELSTGHIPNIYEIFLPSTKLPSQKACASLDNLARKEEETTLEKYVKLLTLEIEQCYTGTTISTGLNNSPTTHAQKRSDNHRIVERNNYIINKIKSFSKNYSNFLNSMLSVDSKKRPDSSKLLVHPFITSKLKSTASFNNDFQSIERELYHFNNSFSITEFFKQKIISRLFPGSFTSSPRAHHHTTTPHYHSSPHRDKLQKENKSVEKINFNYIQDICHNYYDEGNPNVKFSLSDDD